MANPNKTIARARRAMGGFEKREPTPARAAEQAEFAAFMDWCVAQAKAGRHFASVDEARAAHEADRSSSDERYRQPLDV